MFHLINYEMYLAFPKGSPVPTKGEPVQTEGSPVTIEGGPVPTESSPLAGDFFSARTE